MAQPQGRREGDDPNDCAPDNDNNYCTSKFTPSATAGTARNVTSVGACDKEPLPLKSNSLPLVENTEPQLEQPRRLQQQGPLGQLPVEILARIFSFLPEPRLLQCLKLAHVSKQFYQVL